MEFPRDVEIIREALFDTESPMTLLPALAVAFAAFCVWLTVRTVNRRERWAKWTLTTLACVPILYVLSFGPACWVSHGYRILTRTRITGWVDSRFVIREKCALEIGFPKEGRPWTVVWRGVWWSGLNR